MNDLDVPEHTVPRDGVPLVATLLFVAVGAFVLVVAIFGAGQLVASFWPDDSSPVSWEGPAFPPRDAYGSERHVTQSAGSEHCGWQSVQILAVPSEVIPGAPPRTTVLYAWDTKNALRHQAYALQGTLDRDAELPSDATASPYRAEDTELWFSPSAGSTYAYIVEGDTVERWPRFDGGCD